LEDDDNDDDGVYGYSGTKKCHDHYHHYILPPQ